MGTGLAPCPAHASGFLPAVGHLWDSGRAGGRVDGPPAGGAGGISGSGVQHSHVLSWPPALGLVTRRVCSRIANTVCGCDHGRFCVSKDGDHCDACRPHSTCRPGQRVQETGEAPPADPYPSSPGAHCLPRAAGSTLPWPLQASLVVRDLGQLQGGTRAHAPGRDPMLPGPVPLPGTESRDTVCGDCPPGTFSPNGSLEQCQPWTR